MPTAADQLTVSLAGEDPNLVAELRAAEESRGGPIPLDALVPFLKACEAKARVHSGQPRDIDRTGSLPRSVEVGEVTLQSLCVGGSIAARKLVALAPHLDQLTHDILLAWIHAHSWDTAALSRLVDLASAQEIVAEWSAHLNCSWGDLLAGIDRLNDNAYPEQTPGQATEPDPIATLDGMLKRYGGSVKDMLETPLSTAAHLMDAANHTEIAAAAKQARAAGQQPPIEADPKFQAEKALQAAKENLSAPSPPST
jgi:hypothetical protein